MASREKDELGAEQHYAQFDPDLTSDPKLLFPPEELEEMNRHLEKQMQEPIDWSKGLDD